MTTIPIWWLVISAVLMVCQLLFFAALAFAVWKLAGAVSQLKPKVEEVSGKIESIATKVDGLTTTVKDTVETLSGRAKHVAGSAEIIAHTAATTFERFSPVVVGILGALRILKAVQEVKAARKPASATASDKGSTALSKVDRKKGK